MITPLAGRPPTISKSLNLTSHSQWFIQWFQTRGITHFITYTQSTTERWEKKNKRRNFGQLQAQERVFCDTLHSPCICRLSLACILGETSTKATRNVDSSLTVFPHSLLLTVLPLDCYLKPTVLLCSLLSTASFRLPLSTHPLSSLGPSFPPPHTQYNEWPHSVT